MVDLRIMNFQFFVYGYVPYDTKNSLFSNSSIVYVSLVQTGLINYDDIIILWVLFIYASIISSTF